MAVAPPNRIAELRKAKNLSQEALADAASVHWTSISKLERGRMRLTEDWMRKLAPILEVPPAALMVETRHIANITVAGTVGHGGGVKLRTEGDVQYLAATAGFFTNPNAFWLEIADSYLEPAFPRGGYVKCEWLDRDDYERAIGRPCFVETDTDQGLIGILQRSIKRDSRGNQTFFDVTWKGARRDGINPDNVAIISAVVYPDLDGKTI